MKKQIKIGFSGIHYFHKPTDHNKFFLDMDYILKEFTFKTCANPEFVISNERKPPKIPGVRKYIYYNPENVRPPIDKFDWSFSADYARPGTEHKYLRLPNFVKFGAGQDLIDVKKDLDIEKVMAKKDKFCVFLYWHPVSFRNAFFDALSKYKRVDSPGKCKNNMNNVGGYRKCAHSRFSKNYCDEKIDAISRYKFVIAFENSSYPGYCTEKIYHPMLVNSIPIYWGNPMIYKDFNGNSFIHPYDGNKRSEKDIIKYLVDRVIEIDQDDTKYAAMLQEPWYNGNMVPDFLNKKKILNRFKKIFLG